MGHDWLEWWKSTLKFNFLQQIALKVIRSCLFYSRMTIGFKKGNKFIPTSSKGTSRKKRFSESTSYKKQIQNNQTMHTEGIRLKRDHGIPQKRSGLNKVTIMEFKRNGKPYSPRLFQVNMNGVGAHFPANKELAIELATADIETAKHNDKTGHKIGTWKDTCRMANFIHTQNTKREQESQETRKQKLLESEWLEATTMQRFLKTD